MDDVERAWLDETERQYRYFYGLGEFKVKDDIEIPDWLEEERYESIRA